MSESKFAAFINEKKLNPQRILSASHKLETLRPEDRTIRLEKRRAKKGDAPAEGKKDLAKPRTGRPVTNRALDAAVAGKPLTGPQKQRLLRAVNHLLEQKKAEKVELKTLF